MSLHFRSRVSVLSILAACVTMGAFSASAHATNSIAVHWSGYAGNNHTDITTTDGIVPNSHWTNVNPDWYKMGSTNNTNLVDDNGVPSGAAVTCASPTNVGGTYWWAWTAAIDNLLQGPGGGDGGGNLDSGGSNPGGSNVVPSVITGIPYSNYEIIAYANDVGYPANLKVWLDSAPGASSNPTNPALGDTYYFAATRTTDGFVPVTNTDSSLSPLGNYMVFSGLSGADQTLWLGTTNGAGNYGFTGFEIVETPAVLPEPASLSLLALGGLLLIRRRR